LFDVLKKPEFLIRCGRKIRHQFESEEKTMQVISYLNFDGNCEAAFNFYAKCMGGKIAAMLTHEGIPEAGQVPAEWRSKIVHARMTIGDQTIMGSDVPPSRFLKPQGFSVNIQVKDPAEADKIFRALAENAQATVMPIQETFWAVRFGMLVDKFGIPWMVNCEKAS
jgi:PhnB protein